MSALREILAAFSISVEDDELHKASKHIDGFIGKLQAVVPIVAEAFAIGAITEFIGATVEAGAHVYDLANKLGVGTTELQQFQFAAKLTGVEAETAAHSLGFLNKAVGEALTGQTPEAAKEFAALGVKIKDSAGHARTMSEILPDVADALKKLPDQQTRAAYAMKLFGREGQALLPVLGQGSEKLREVYAEFEQLGGGMSDEFVKQSKETQDNIDKLKFSLQGVRNQIVSALLPAVTWIVDKGKEFIAVIREWSLHTNVLRSGLAALSTLFAGKMVLSVIKVLRVIGLLKGTVLGTLRAFAGFAWPLALIGALYLIFDDFFTLLDGGDSEIGAILESLGGVEGKNKFVDDLRDSWKQLLALFGDGEPTVNNATDGLNAFGFAAKFVGLWMYELVVIVKTLFDGLVGISKVAWEAAKAIDHFFGVSAEHEGEGSPGKAIDTAGGVLINDFKDLFNPGNHKATAGAVPPPEPLVPIKNFAGYNEQGQARSDLGNGWTAPGEAIPTGPAQPPPLVWRNLDSPTVKDPRVSKGSGLFAETNKANAASVHIDNLNVKVEGGKNPEETGKRVGQGAGTELQKTLRDAHAALGAQ